MGPGDEATSAHMLALTPGRHVPLDTSRSTGTASELFVEKMSCFFNVKVSQWIHAYT